MNPNRLIASAAVALLLGCSGRDAEIGNGAGAAPSVKSEPPAAPALSSLQMADPAGTAQLLSGFHGLEQNAWRWTERRFSVMLGLPRGSTPTQLHFRFAISPVVIGRLKSQTLTASAQGVAIGSESYDAAGEYLFSKPLAPTAAKTGSMRIDFELDHAVPAGELETRELGVIAISASAE
jgi:hypothetical protein